MQQISENHLDVTEDIFLFFNDQYQLLFLLTSTDKNQHFAKVFVKMKEQQQVNLTEGGF